MTRVRNAVRKTVIITLVLGSFVFFTLSLRADELEKARVRLTKCDPVPDAVLDVIAARLNEKAGGGILRFGHITQSRELPGQPWFVSAQLRRPGRPRTAPGDILTWVTAAPPTPATADYGSVDTNARRLSDWPAAADNVRVTIIAAIDSRACVHETRPGSKGLFH